MGQKEILSLIANARTFAEKDDYYNAKKAYQKVIGKLKATTQTEQNIAELWTTQAEYLNFRAKFVFSGESVEDSRRRQIESLRLLNNTAKLSNQMKEKISPKIRESINQLILILGCIMPESDTQVHVSCPIRIRKTGAGKLDLVLGCFMIKLCARYVVGIS
jgi:hypothetical protein